jgi:cell division protein FtsB
MGRKKAKQWSVKDYVKASLLSVVLIWLLFMNVNIIRKEEIARKAAHDTQAQLASRKARQNTLQGSINELSTPRGQEATVRETFGVAKPGEGEIIVVPPKEATTTPPVSFWHRWFGWIGA